MLFVFGWQIRSCWILLQEPFAFVLVKVGKVVFELMEEPKGSLAQLGIWRDGVADKKKK